MLQDPFSDFLHFMRARSIMSGGLIAGGAWAISIPAADRIKFWGVLRGSCWLVVDGEQTPIRVEEGDVFLLSAARTHVLATDLDAERADLSDVLKGRSGAIVWHGEGDDFFMVGGKVELSAEGGHLLLDALPPLIHIRAASSQAPVLHWLLEQLVRERDNDLPGAAVASAQLAHLMFIQILRAYFEAAGPVAVGWLRAVSDKRLAPAIRLMHGDPGHPWQLGELAAASAMSRATFEPISKPLPELPLWPT